MGPKNSKDCSWGDAGILKMGPMTKSGLPRTHKNYNFGHECGRRGSPGAHIKRGRSHELQKVFKYLPGLRDAILNSKMTAKVKKNKNTVFYRIFLIYWVGGMGGALY